MVGAMGKFWLMKSEPDTFGIDDLARVKIEPWTGVRSYFARAHMRAMSVGDAVLFHHSNATPPGIAGLARVVRTQVVDETQFDPGSKYYDPKATRDQPIWDCVEVEYVATLPHFVAMDRVRAEPTLSEMLLLRRGMRLSVQPVTEAEYEAIVALGQIAPPAVVARAATTPTTKPVPRAAGKAAATRTAKRPSAPARTAKAKRNGATTAKTKTTKRTASAASAKSAARRR